MDSLKFVGSTKLSEKEKKLVVEGLKTGIGFEKKSFNFYSRQAAATEHPEIKQIFEFLAGQEKEHLEALETEHQALLQKGIWAEVDLGRLGKGQPEVYKKGSKEFQQMSKNDFTVVLWAMRVEKKYENFYRELAGKSSSESVKGFFTRLAEFELEHYNLLDGLFEIMSTTEDIIWN